MKKYLMLLALVAPILDAFAGTGYFFSLTPPRTERWGMGRIEEFPHPSLDESDADAREYCVQAGAAELIRRDSALRANALAILPQSPIAPAVLQVIYVAAPALKRTSTSYRFPQNQCVRGYADSKSVLASMIRFENLYAGFTTCSAMYGDDQVAHHALCIATVAEHLEQ